MRRTGHIPVGYNRDVHNTKRKWREYGGFDVVEASGNGRTIAVPTNEHRELSAYKYTEIVNAKLTPRASSSIGRQLATNKSGIVESFSKPKSFVCGRRGSSGSRNKSDASANLNSTEGSIFEKSVSASPSGELSFG
jgi:hypothetical protein